MKIACIGDNTIDYYDETCQSYPGGNSVNVSVYLRRLGVSSSYTGAVGNDSYGRTLLYSLKARGVDVSRVRICPGNTAVCHVSVVNGERVFGDYDEGVLAGFCPDAGDMDFLASHDLVVTSLWGHSESVLPEMWSRGIPTAYDAADLSEPAVYYKALPYATVFFFSDDVSSADALKDKLREFKAHGPSVAVAMRGSSGSLAFDGVTFYEYGIVPCEVIDTIGAGDSYIAGFLKAWLEKQPIESCMEAGARNAAVTIGYSGAWS
ncbi:MAG: fructoselysine 6-kinase [Oscillospiraceae bacterium]|nr:fructoselysine 6-kinase [Oscillospiraceae bacterium]